MIFGLMDSCVRRKYNFCGAGCPKFNREHQMKLVNFETKNLAVTRPGLLTERGIVDISTAVREDHTPQLTMQGIIDQFDELRSGLEDLAQNGPALPNESVRLRPP